MHRRRARRLLLLSLCGLLSLLVLGCGTLDNEIHITYRTPTSTVTTVVMRGTGPMEEVLLGGPLRDDLSQAGWTVSSDDGGDGPAMLRATYEANDGRPFPQPAPARGDQSRAPDIGNALFRSLEARTDEQTFVRRLTVKFTNEPGALTAPGLDDPRTRQLLDNLMGVVGGPAPGQGQMPGAGPAGPDFDQKSFDLMLDAVVNLRVVITVPGTVKETNADSHSGSDAVWRLGAGALRESRDYYVIGEEMLWGKVAAAAGSVALILAAFGLVAVYLLGRRRPAPAPAPAAAASDLPPEKTPEEQTALRLPEEPEDREEGIQPRP